MGSHEHEREARGRARERHQKDAELEARLAEKDAEIIHLRLGLHTHLNTHARLEAALEVLDELQRQLSAEVEENARLRETLARYRGVVRKAERERDELRDAVVEFVEKVERSNGKDVLEWTWARSRIRIPCLLDPIAPLPSAHPASTVHEGTDHRWDYAAHTIRSLRAELEAERRDHAVTRAGARRLEARLARVEAEACACSASSALILGGSNRAAERHGEELSDEERKQEMRALLAYKTARNRVLETEVGTLGTRVEEARLAAAVKVAEEKNKRRYSASDAGVQPEAGQERRRSHTRPSSDSAAPFPDGGTSVDPLRRQRPSSSRRRRSRSRARARSSSTAAPAPDALNVGVDHDPDRTIRPVTHRPPDPLLRARSAPASAHPDANTESAGTDSAHALLDREIARLGAQIEAFQVEREELRLQVLQTEGPAEDESRARAAQSQVPHAQTHTQPAHTQPTTHPTTQATLVPHPHPLDDSDGERSMELATPLVASLILPAPHLYSHLHLPSAVRAPTPHPHPLAMEMSPLDLTADLPGPSSQPGAEPPGERTDAAGEQAVQELMDLAAARRRDA
ncbi:hypothetical protein FB451DRAFT_1255404 [Mycena latifolia]|nr:hypothetical protein FB451DRAFT_1255404 [Mycena latifolia]